MLFHLPALKRRHANAFVAFLVVALLQPSPEKFIELIQSCQSGLLCFPVEAPLDRKVVTFLLSLSRRSIWLAVLHSDVQLAADRRPISGSINRSIVTVCGARPAPC